MPKIRIVIAEDHHLVRKGLVNLISQFERIEIVRDVENGKELISLVEKEKPDVVVVDLEMPLMNGTVACEGIVERFPNVKILVLSAFEEDSVIAKLLRIGVHGYLLKKVQPKELERAIYSVFDNDFYQNDLTLRVMRSNMQTKKVNGLGSTIQLSDREIEVLKLICKEMSAKEIGDRLNISEKTVFAHRLNLIEKIGCRNSVGLVLFALENQFLKVGRDLD